MNTYDDQECKRCHRDFDLHAGYEATEYCDDCAQVKVIQLEKEVDRLERLRDSNFEDLIRTCASGENKTKIIKEAWSIIDGLITGMLISDPKWKPAADWLNKNRGLA